MTLLRIVIPIAISALISWSDHATGSVIWRLFSPFLGALIILVFFPLWPAPAYWSRAVVVTGAALWLVALPWIPWNQVKRFYRDCGRIQPGWSLAQAREMMAPYVLANVAPGKANPELELDWPHLTFWPERSRGADWCVVFNQGDQVREVATYPD